MDLSIVKLRQIQKRAERYRKMFEKYVKIKKEKDVWEKSVSRKRSG
jgi:hypothetical protein